MRTARAAAHDALLQFPPPQTSAQELALTDMLGAFCDLYNAGLQQRIEAYLLCGVRLGSSFCGIDF